MLDLFGIEVDDYQKKPRVLGIYQQFKHDNQYRETKSRTEKCGLCKYCFSRAPHKATYYKCELLGESMSAASDIRLSHVCNLFNSGK